MNWRTSFDLAQSAGSPTSPPLTLVLIVAATVAAKQAGAKLDWRSADADDLAGPSALDPPDARLSAPKAQVFTGQIGQSATPLWPVGTCEFGGKWSPPYLSLV